MNTIWNMDGTQIFSLTNNRFDGMQMFTTGYGRAPVAGEPYRWFQWTATVTNRGWNVTLETASGRVGEYQGLTFNLPLEIASAAGRLL